MIERSIENEALRFHMPGHKGMPVLPGARWDVTELPDTDELFHPESGILLAQREAARCWGAAHSFLLVNGSSAGIQAMVLWAKSEGYRLLLPRDSHISAVYACALAGLQPEWLLPQWNQTEQLNQWEGGALDRVASSGKIAILPTYPDYFGRCIDLRELRGHPFLCEAAVLTDSAHGSHFIFSDKLPEDAGVASDFWVSGVHKTLPAPTQTAFLHVKEEKNAAAAGRMLRAVTTTSPSFLLMMGADDGRAMMQERVGQLNEVIDRCLELAERLNGIGGLRCWTQRDALAMGYARLDPTRIVVDVSALGMTGWEACRKLAESGVVAEMGDIRRVVLIVTAMDDGPRLERVLQAFLELGAGGKGDARAEGLEQPGLGRPVMTLREAWLSRAEELPYGDCAGRIAAEPFGAYPPGTALCMPGEVISEGVLETVRRSLALGGSLFGCRRGKLAVIIE